MWTSLNLLINNFGFANEPETSDNCQYIFVLFDDIYAKSTQKKNVKNNN